MREQRLRVAIVGAGNIAGPYGAELVADPLIQVAGVTDLDPERARTLADTLGCGTYPSLDAALADPEVDAIVTLTPHRLHAEVSRRALMAGKHAYSEKPLAVDPADARELVEEARRRNLRLACAPSTFMGEAQQTAWKLLREGRVGTVRVIYAEVNWGRIESWHPAPEAFYDIGVMIDVGIYPLSLITCMFGPAKRVSAFGTVLYPERLTKTGQPFHVETPEFVVAMVELAGGPIVRLTANWYVEQRNSKQAGVEFHGDDGSLSLSSWLSADASVEIAPVGGPYEQVPLLRTPEKGIIWSRAVSDLARALQEDRPNRADGEHSAHLVDILHAITRSIETERPVEVTSSFTQPAPVEWAQ